MRTMPLLISCVVIGALIATGCRREAPGTGDTTDQVTAAEQPAGATTAPIPDAATANTLQLVTAGAAQPYLADSAGRALYYVEGDNDGSKCTGDCTRAWPPLFADETMPSGSANLQPGMIGVIERADGSRQVTYNGHPLYHYAADTSAERAAGNGVRDQWGQWHALDAVGEPLPMKPAQ